MYQKLNDNKTYTDNIASVIYGELDNSYTKFKNITANNILNKYFTIYKRCFYVDGHNNCSEYDNPNGLGQSSFEIKTSYPEKFGLGLKETYTLKETEKDMLIDRFYGGVMMIKEYETYTEPVKVDDRIIRVTSNDFMIGDVLIMHDDDYEVESALNYEIAEKGIYLRTARR